MQFISENLIEQAAELLNASEDNYERAIDEMRLAQPVLLSYLFTENFQAFTRREQEYLLYLMLVVWKAISLSGDKMPAVTEQQLSQVEDYNWELLQGVKAKGFHERLNVFFDGHPQEDLLAFIEDALSGEEEEEEEEEGEAPPATREGREAIFVSLKSAADCLTGWK